MSFLAGKTILLTGATGGIGAEVARQLSAEGARLILTGRSVEKLRALQNQLAAETLIYPCDLTSTAEQQGLLQFCQQQGGVDVLVRDSGPGAAGALRRVADVGESGRVGVNNCTKLCATSNSASSTPSCTTTSR